jgi:hypothetical protein
MKTLTANESPTAILNRTQNSTKLEYRKTHSDIKQKEEQTNERQASVTITIKDMLHFLPLLALKARLSRHCS